VDSIVSEHEPLRLRSRLLGDPIDWVVRHAHCDVLLVDNLGYDDPELIVLSGDGGPYPPLTVNIAEAIAAANNGTVSLWYPGGRNETEQYTQTIDDYQTELSEMLAVPVQAESIQFDGGQPSDPDMVVRQGTDERLQSILFDESPAFPNPGCTTITVHSHTSRQPRFTRQLLERLTF
jgi:hypothetical protein